MPHSSWINYGSLIRRKVIQSRRCFGVDCLARITFAAFNSRIGQFAFKDGILPPVEKAFRYFIIA